MRIVLDANVVIAAFAARGLCESVFELCLHDHQILLSEGLLEEILRNLRRKLKLPKRVVGEIYTLLLEQTKIYEPVVLPSDICRDPNDGKILGLAVAGQADYIVTGDQDLLIMEKFRGISILTPRSFSAIPHKEGI